VAFRRHGHNELDSPQATLPLTYERIQKHPRVLDLYAADLQARGLIPDTLLDSLKAQIEGQYEEEFAAYESGLYREQPRDWLATSWQGDALQVTSPAADTTPRHVVQINATALCGLRAPELGTVHSQTGLSVMTGQCIDPK